MIIVSFTFLIPPESGERIGVVITVLLVFAVYLEVISKSLPKTSSSIPALSLFYMAAMVTSSCSLLGTCAVLVVHFTGNRKGVQPVPRWIITLYAGLIRDVASYPSEEKDCGTKDQEETEEDVGKEEETDKIQQISNASTSLLSKEFAESDVHEWKAVQCGDLIHIIRAGEKEMTPQPSPITKSTFSYDKKTTEDLDNEIKRITKRLRRLNHEEVIREQWQKLAKLLDWMFFILFLVLFNVLSLSILLPVYIAREQHQPHIPVDDGH